MTDPSLSEATEKTTAELESEARERARLAMASPELEQKTPPGQPEVTRFRKTSGRRTLMVSLVSLALLIALALGGDRFLGALKKGDKKEADTAPAPSTGAGQHARTNLGMDNNPLGLFGQNKPEMATDKGQAQTAAPSPQEPPTLNKAMALAFRLSKAT